MAKQNKKQSPRTIAVQDIRVELDKEGKCFIAFRTELNPIMREIIKEYNRQQKEADHGIHSSK